VNRGDVVVAALPGDAGKPRPWIVLRADRFADHSRVTLLPLTSELQDAPILRVDVSPSADNGLRVPSQAMVDRSVSVPVQRVGLVIGRLDPAAMRAIDRAMLVYLGFAG
jgi:mRNA interferase MazF